MKVSCSKKRDKSIYTLNCTIGNNEISLNKELDIFSLIQGYLLKNVKTYTFIYNDTVESLNLKQFLTKINNPLIQLTLSTFKIRNLLKSQNINIKILGRISPSVGKSYVKGDFIKKEKISIKEYKDYFSNFKNIEYVYSVRNSLILELYNTNSFDAQYELNYALCDAISSMYYRKYINKKIDISNLKLNYPNIKAKDSTKIKAAISSYIMYLIYGEDKITDDGNRIIIKNLLINFNPN